ncbi:MAG TPA: hypothetical protein VGL06_28790 [Pseudonocardiaceae bacterium]|jgi:hypothetical protein
MRPWGLPALLLVSGLLAGCTSTTTGPAPAALVTCAGGTVIQPAGAPYCYLLPAGFTDYTGKVTVQVQSDVPTSYASVVGIAVYDSIQVSVVRLRADSDSISMAALTDGLSSSMSNMTAHGLIVGQSTSAAPVDNDRTVQVTLTKGNLYTSTIYAVFRGYTEIAINCQSSEREPDVDRACASIRQTIRIVDLPR